MKRWFLLSLLVVAAVPLISSAADVAQDCRELLARHDLLFAVKKIGNDTVVCGDPKNFSITRDDTGRVSVSEARNSTDGCDPCRWQGGMCVCSGFSEASTSTE